MNYPTNIRECFGSVQAPARKEASTEELTALVLDWAQEKVKEITSCAPDKLLQELIAMPSQNRYSLFYGLGYGTDFPGIIELYYHLAGAVYDDGDVSFVCARVKDTGRLPGGRTVDLGTMNTYFVMNGDRDDLIPEKVSKIALEHHGSRSRVISFRACRFDMGLFEIEAKRIEFMRGTPERERFDRKDQADRFYDRYIAQKGYNLRYI